MVEEPALRARDCVTGATDEHFSSTDNDGVIDTAWPCGNWGAAYDDAVNSWHRATSNGDAWLTAHSLAGMAIVEAGRGDEAACRRHAIEVLELGRRHGERQFELLAGAALGLLALGMGRHDEACAELLPLRTVPRSIGAQAHALSGLESDLIESLVRAGRRDEAVRILSERYDSSRVGDAAGAIGTRCLALTVCKASAEPLYVKALEHHGRVVVPFDQARTELCFGEWLRRHQELTRSRRYLRAALATFERLGASPWVRRTDREIRATGGRFDRNVSLTDGFTPQEREVAFAVARGITNKQAAASLFLSTKTIEFHLSSVYRKLNINSRSQLVRLLSSQRDPEVEAAPALDRTRGHTALT